MTRPHPALAAAAVAATYAYFLIFAEFAFLELVRTAGGPGAPVRPVMAVLALAGVAGSLLAARWFDPARAGRALAAGFAACATGAGLAVVAPPGWFFGVALVAGSGLGWLTVTLVASLRGLVGEARLGLWIGTGTGAAYAFCNLPWLFAATPRKQTLVAAILALLGAGLTRRWRAGAVAPVATREHTGRGRIAWVVWLLALVWLDSAAFYIIQHTPDLRGGTWSGTWTLAGNALVHLAAAVAAGVLADRGRAVPVVVAAFGLLLAACGQLTRGETTGVSAAYAAAVSLYSTLLVFHPAQSGRPWRAAVVFAVAGWGGSALGVGMAQDLQRIPPWFPAAGVAVFAAAWWLRRGRRAAGVTGAFLLAGVLWAGGSRAEADPVARGREVYISEGCIHCHSQYVRPGTADEERWGPASSLPELRLETPPLPGNRRQGPDLANVGARRSPAWNRLHLSDPQAVTPGSRMPAYAHLFAGENPPGEALLAYLASLGTARAAEQRAAQAAWRPQTATDAPPEPRRLYARLCAGCHGAEGRGDGPLAARLGGPPPDFSAGAWRHIPADDPEPVLALSRIIKFGLSGTDMAGHEYLEDAAVVSLAHFVRTLHATRAKR